MQTRFAQNTLKDKTVHVQMLIARKAQQKDFDGYLDIEAEFIYRCRHYEENYIIVFAFSSFGYFMQ